jgi:hypothetical protein
VRWGVNGINAGERVMKTLLIGIAVRYLKKYAAELLADGKDTDKYLAAKERTETRNDEKADDIARSGTSA